MREKIATGLALLGASLVFAAMLHGLSEKTKIICGALGAALFLGAWLIYPKTESQE